MAGMNPYTPGAGTRPLELAGRESQLALLGNLAELVEAGRAANPMIYTGLRGVGKTSLLHEARDVLRDRGWLAGYYEVRRDVEPGIAIRSIIQDSAQMSTGTLRKALASGGHSIGRVKLHLGPSGFGFEIDARTDVVVVDDPYQNLVRFLQSVGRLAKASGVGVALIIDEIQVFAKRDLSMLIQALSALKQEPIALIGAGLPYVAAEMSKSNTYAERFRFEKIDRLSDQDARLAIVGPALSQGTTWDEEAVTRLLSLSEGYPYFVQLYASEAWQSAGQEVNITVEHVQASLAVVRAQLDTGLYSARYDRLSEREREYVDAMVDVADATGEHPTPTRVSSGDIGKLLGKSLPQLATTRDRIVRKGIIHSPVFGVLEFSVPGFSDYVRRQTGRAQ
ncbi:MAG: ATP-binding protein [Rhodoglobus sp.]